MRKCLFCSKAAGNREHVVAEWLSKAMERRTDAVVPVVMSGNVIIKERPAIKFEHLRTGVVCQGCNNGWMSRMESDFKQAFEHLVRPGAFSEAEAVKTLMESNWDLLVRWLLKSAIIGEQSLPRVAPSIMVRDLFDVRHGVPANQHFFVYAAEIVEPGFNWQLRKGYRTFNGGIYHDDYSHKHGLNFAVQLNHLALGLINCPGAFPGAQSPYGIQGRRIMPLLAGMPVSFDFPVSHVFMQFDDFTRCVEVYATTPTGDRPPTA